jgi:hypothetical protein
MKILLILFGGTYALFFVVTALQRFLIVTCDSAGCEVNSKFFWQAAGKTYSIKWSEVTDTKFKRIATSAKSSSVFFCIVTDNKVHRLFRRNWFAADQLEKFVALVNQATPHLPHAWLKGETNLQVLEKVGKFKRVLRTGMLATPPQSDFHNSPQ